MERIINMVEGINIRSEKQTSISIFFFHRLVFFIICLCCTVLKFKCSYSKYNLFLDTFCRKMATHILIEQKKLKSLKTENVDQPPKSGHLRIANSFDQTSWCPLFRGLTIIT